MSQGTAISQDIKALQDAVKELGDGINHSGVNWGDEKFEELKKTIQGIAKSSKQVMQANTNCEKAIRNFKQAESM